MKKKLALLFSFIIIIHCVNVAALSFDGNNSKSSNKDSENFIKVEKINDRWYFIDSNDEPFIATSICGVNAHGYFCPKLGYSPYQENITRIYGSPDVWANATKARMDEWGFNSLGSGSDQYIRDTGLHFTEVLGLAGSNWETRPIQDYFSKDWIESVDEKCKSKCIPLVNNTNLIGYFLANELRWGPEFQDLGDLFDAYCGFQWDSEGKIFLVKFLKNRYNGDIKAFNRAWRMNLGSFNQIYDIYNLGIYPRSLKAKEDRTDFGVKVAEQFFKTCHDAIRKYDKNHLILGARFLSYGTPHEVLKVCAKYSDVISINHYPILNVLKLSIFYLKVLFNFTSTKFNLIDYYMTAKKPILVSEIHFRAWDTGHPNTDPSPLLMPVKLNQRSRANSFYRMIAPMMKKPYFIGYQWYSWVDEPKLGRYDGEDSNIGVVNEYDQPYLILINKMKEINAIGKNCANSVYS